MNFYIINKILLFIDLKNKNFTKKIFLLYKVALLIFLFLIRD